MKVKCVDTGEYPELTQGKIYDVEQESKSFYKVVNDQGSSVRYFKTRFEVVNDQGLTKNYFKGLFEAIEEAESTVLRTDLDIKIQELEKQLETLRAAKENLENK